MAGVLLGKLLGDGLQATIKEVNEIHTDIRYLMSALGCETLEDLHHTPSSSRGMCTTGLWYVALNQNVSAEGEYKEKNGSDAIRLFFLDTCIQV